jgi:hypothetical protein
MAIQNARRKSVIILSPSRVRNGAGISGAKGRDKRPGLDAMLNDASRRRFDVAMGHRYTGI